MVIPIVNARQTLVMPQNDASPSIIDISCLFYLSLPLVIFIASWTNYIIGLPAFLLTIYAIWQTPKINFKPNWLNTAVALVVSFLAVRFSGISPWVNSVPLLDITKHRWLLNDLYNHSWPVHLAEDGKFYILRYSLGFYLIPALTNKIVGHMTQTPFLGWMTCGTFLAIVCVLDEVKSKWLIIPIAVFMPLFGGLDVIGVLLTTPHRTGAGLGEFSVDWAINPYGWVMASNSFAFSWSPQHAIAGWLGGALLLRNWDKLWFQRRSLGVFVALAFWSPFTALSFGGILSFIFIWRFSKTKEIPDLFSSTNVAALAPLFLIVAYYSLGHATDGKFTPESFAFFILYLRFVLLEFGILALLCFAIVREETVVLSAALVVILIYPMFRIGGAVNDLVMSGSRLPLMILTLFIIRSIQEKGHKTARVLLVVFSFVGVYGGFNETYRLLRAPKVNADWTASIMSMDRNYRPQYIAPLPTGVRSWIFH